MLRRAACDEVVAEAVGDRAGSDVAAEQLHRVAEDEVVRRTAGGFTAAYAQVMLNQANDLLSRL